MKALIIIGLLSISIILAVTNTESKIQNTNKPVSHKKINTKEENHEAEEKREENHEAEKKRDKFVYNILGNIYSQLLIINNITNNIHCSSFNDILDFTINLLNKTEIKDITEQELRQLYLLINQRLEKIFAETLH